VTPRPNQRGQNYTDRAKSLLRFITGDPNIGSTSEESAVEQADSDDDFEYDSVFIESRRVSLNSLRIVLEMVDKEESERRIRGRYDWFRRQNVAVYKRMYAQGGQARSIYQAIGEYVEREVSALRHDLKPVHDETILALGARRARELGFKSFKGSKKWLERFKKQYGYSSRAVVDHLSTAQIQREGVTQARSREFLESFRRYRSYFRPNLCWNLCDLHLTLDSSK
jgi:hypothetical protein